ncbi:MAG: hypothetical protein ACC658_05160 [Acidimicrobiia bacterium]
MSETTPTFFAEVLERSRQDSGLEESEFGKTPYDMYCVPLEVYRKYKDEVLRLSLSYSKWVASQDGGVLLERVDQLSDAELSERLDLDEDTVRRIRCMAEWDLPMEVLRNAAEFKRRRRRDIPAGSPRRYIRDEPC